MSRAELLVPEGWAPRRGSVVELLPNRDEPVPPAGAWRIIDRSNTQPGPWWWAQPHDDEARHWAARHSSRIVQGCLDVKGLSCVPPGHVARPPERKSRGGRR